MKAVRVLAVFAGVISAISVCLGIIFAFANWTYNNPKEEAFFMALAGIFLIYLVGLVFAGALSATNGGRRWPWTEENPNARD